MGVFIRVQAQLQTKLNHREPKNVMLEGSRRSTGYCRGIISTSSRQSDNLVSRAGSLGEREDTYYDISQMMVIFIWF